MRGSGSPACTSLVSIRMEDSDIGRSESAIVTRIRYRVFMRPTERFSSRVEDYVRYRPSYPRAAIDLLKTRCGLSPAAVVADIGSGTGILAELLLASGAQVIGVEPNDAMRRSEEHTSELQSPCNLVCRLLLEKKKKHRIT